MPLAESVGFPEGHVAFLEGFQALENAPEGRTGLSQAWQQVTGTSPSTPCNRAQLGPNNEPAAVSDALVCWAPNNANALSCSSTHILEQPVPHF